MGLIRGVGVNDSGYVTTKYKYFGKTKRRVWICPYFSRWRSMIERCYGNRERPCYEGCSVSDSWLLFSNFKRWMERQDWENKQLDKDLLVKENKVYSDTTCIFIDKRVNVVIADVHKARGASMKGTWYDIERDNYQATGNKYPSGKKYMIGRYQSELSAHSAWKNHKREVLGLLRDDQSDLRVQSAINRIIEELN